MKKTLLLSLLMLTATSLLSAQEKTSPLYVDHNGVWRNTATNQEVAYFGVNYTLPFAHSYRAAGYLGVDRKKAIDEDVRQMARLGLNAFRVHIWDVEISDREGNLTENDHLNLLDYLIYKLEQNGIDIILTAQTNFGNGYPEHDIITDGYSYLYNKCETHSAPKAIAAQQKYIGQLIRHLNPYNSQTYNTDQHIVAIEINNEPCHPISASQTREYIDTMCKTLRDNGLTKTILYNMSHNPESVPAYLDAQDVDGGTFQWYPTGLVSETKKTGNYLPYVDEYKIDFANDDRFRKKCKVIYEFDAGDVADSYLYPAAARTFRSAGFQWATMFAYDATFLAPYNTDYQTHYLNLVYTPAKAIGLMIAAEVMKTEPMYQEYPKYPADTVFGNFELSYARDLAVMNSNEKLLYTNYNTAEPRNPRKLRTIAGVGCSKIVRTAGNGAHFLDKISKNEWQLEIYPNIVEISDPFAKPSLDHKVRTAIEPYSDIEKEIYITLNLPDFEEVSLFVKPGKYSIKKEKGKIKIDTISHFHTFEKEDGKDYMIHEPVPHIERGMPLPIEINTLYRVDSAVIYPSSISFWNKSNPSLTLKDPRCNYCPGYLLEGEIPQEWLGGDCLKYQIVVYRDGRCTTYPSGRVGNPLDWDAADYQYFSTGIVENYAPITLIANAASDHGIYLRVSPEWDNIHIWPQSLMPQENDRLKISSPGKNSNSVGVVYKDIRSEIKNRERTLANVKNLFVRFAPIEEDITLKIGFVDASGISHTATCNLKKGDDIAKIDLKTLQNSNTIFLNPVYPTFLKQDFSPNGKYDLDITQIQVLQIVTSPDKDKFSFGLIGAWLE